MNEIGSFFIILFIIFLFVIVPFWGLLSIIIKTFRSRREGKELDLIEESLNQHINLLKTENIAVFDGQLSNWLDSIIGEIKTPWLKNTLFLAVDAKYLGLGEIHRATLRFDTTYRDNVFRNFRRLAFSFGEGNPEKVLLYLARLYALFLCTKIKKDGTKEKKASFITIDALQKSIDLYHKGNIVITEPISNALEKITLSCTPTEETGVSLLVLRWALREFRDKKPDIKRVKSIMNAKLDGKFNVALLSSSLFK